MLLENSNFVFFFVKVLQHSFAAIAVDLIFFLESNFDPDLTHLSNLCFHVINIYKNQTNQPQTMKYPPHFDVHRFCFFEDYYNNHVNQSFAEKL